HMLGISTCTVERGKLLRRRQGDHTVKALNNAARLWVTRNTRHVSDIHAGKNTGNISIKGLVLLATTVIGIDEQRLAVVFDGEAVSICNRQRAFSERQAPADDVTRPAIDNQRQFRGERLTVYRMRHLKVHGLTVTDPAAVNRHL